ncbi:MAG: hypothetical protein GXX09_09105 [Syntrophomonadaceae bacterium]|nr:hypothetical protein [Syntrophomonadaceae bacterium]
MLRNPGAVRPWQYVLEPLAGYLWLGIWLLRDTAGYSGAWNFGPEGDDLLTVEEVVKLLLEHWDGGEYTVDATRQPYEAGMLRLDTGKARCLLKWAPVYGIREAMERPAAWYRSFYNDGAQKGGSDYTIKEIEDYVRAARRRGVAWATEA